MEPLSTFYVSIRDLIIETSQSFPSKTSLSLPFPKNRVSEKLKAGYMDLTTLIPWILVIGFLLIGKRYLDVREERKDLPGPRFVWPLVGSAFEMILHPFEFYEKQKQYGPISWNLILGQLFVYTRDPVLTKKVFANEGGNLRLWLHMNAEKILGKNNIAFMHGEAHKSLRKELIHLFTKNALSKYLSIQETEIRKHIDRWLESDIVKEPKEIRSLVRDLNVDTSIHVFTGHYMNEETMDGFRRDYLAMNEGLLSFPLNLPGTRLYEAIQARKRIICVLIPIVEASQEKMRDPTSSPECLIDEWMRIVIEKPIEERETSEDYAFHVLDFLFASQDASTSSLVWVFEFLSRNEHVWQSVRIEQDSERPNDEPLTLKMLEKMDVTNRFVKELLRLSSPAVSVPHIAIRDFQLTEDLTIKKGTVLFPSIHWAQTTEEGFKDWRSFDIDRWNQERREESNKNFLAFGYGAHKCLGQEYAQNHLKAFTSIVVRNLDWERIFSDKSHRLEYLPTIVPSDGCIVKIMARK